MEIHIPPANKLPLPARSIAIPVTTIVVTSDNAAQSTSSLKPLFRQATPQYIAHSNNQTSTTLSGRLVAVPQSLSTRGNYAPVTIANNSNQTTTLVTANQHPIPASISLTRAGPPPLIPARAISGTPNPKGVQILRPRLSEGKVVAAAPNVCVTQRGTFVATQLNTTSVPSSGVCVMNHVVGQSPDANALMNKMFSVVRGSENGAPMTITPASVLANISRAQNIQQVAHVRPSVKNENSIQNTSMVYQKTGNANQNASSANGHNTQTSHPSPKTFDSNTNRTTSSTVKCDRNANVSSENTVQKFSLNVGGGMGAVTTAVRSGMLAREKYKLDASRDTKHVITHGGGYSVKINETSLETKSGIRSTTTSIAEIAASQSNLDSSVSERTPNPSVITTNIDEVTPAVSPTPSEEIPLMSDIVTNENEVENEVKDDPENVSINKRGSTWMYRRRKKKKVRFTYVKGKKNKKKDGGEMQENYENGEFEHEFDYGGQIGEHMKKRGRGMKRDHGDDGEF